MQHLSRWICTAYRIIGECEATHLLPWLGILYIPMFSPFQHFVQSYMYWWSVIQWHGKRYMIRKLKGHKDQIILIYDMPHWHWWLMGSVSWNCASTNEKLFSPGLLLFRLFTHYIGHLWFIFINMYSTFVLGWSWNIKYCHINFFISL